MGTRMIQIPQDSTTGESTDPIAYETSFDGQTYNWGPNEMRGFADNVPPTSHIVQSGPTIAVLADNSSSGRYYPNSYEART